MASIRDFYSLHSNVKNFKAIDKDGRTSLYNTAQAGLEPAIRVLIKDGVDVKVVNKDE
jgi:hypothetical protein